MLRMLLAMVTTVLSASAAPSHPNIVWFLTCVLRVTAAPRLVLYVTQLTLLAACVFLQR